MSFVKTALTTAATSLLALTSSMAHAHVEGLGHGGSHPGLLHYLTGPEHLLLALIPIIGFLLLVAWRR